MYFQPAQCVTESGCRGAARAISRVNSPVPDGLWVHPFTVQDLSPQVFTYFALGEEEHNSLYSPVNCVESVNGFESCEEGRSHQLTEHLLIAPFGNIFCRFFCYHKKPLHRDAGKEHSITST